ncbi:MAG: PAS domain-containing protein [Chryseolinea sp.]
MTHEAYSRDVYFTTFYTPIWDDDGIQGIYITIAETTQLVRYDLHLKALRNQLVANLFTTASLAFWKAPVILFLWPMKPCHQYYPKLRGMCWGSLRLPSLVTCLQMISSVFLRDVLITGEKVILPGERAIPDNVTPPEYTYFRVIFEAIRESDNSISGMMIMAEDITEEVTSLKRIEESEIRHKLAIEAAAIGSFDWNLIDSRFQFSPRLASIFGFSDIDSINHHSLVERIHPADRDMRLKAHHVAFETGRLMYETRVVWPDASIHWVRMNGKIVHDEKGKALRMYGTAIDTTDQHLVTDRLESLVKQRTKELEQFAYIASHDLQEPLRKIRTFTELLQQNLHDELTTIRYFEKIKGSAQRIASTKLYAAKAEERLEIQSVHDYWEFSFSDNGIGFDQQHEKKTFTMFSEATSKGTIRRNWHWARTL